MLKNKEIKLIFIIYDHLYPITQIYISNVQPVTVIGLGYHLMRTHVYFSDTLMMSLGQSLSHTKLEQTLVNTLQGTPSVSEKNLKNKMLKKRICSFNTPCR